MNFYAACLASYNSGILHGAWILAHDDIDAMQSEIADMLESSPCPNVKVECRDCEGAGGDCAKCNGAGVVNSAEEWAIHDYDGFPDIGEYPGLEKVARVAEFLENAESQCGESVAYAIMKECGDDIDRANSMAENFIGEYASFRDYADESADEMIACDSKGNDSILARYFDYDSWARDLAFDYEILDTDSGVAIFVNC